MKASRLATLLVFAAALALLVTVWLQYRRDPFSEILISDALSYHRWAERIVENGLSSEPVFHQAPLFPLWLAAIYRVSPAGSPPTLAILVQILLTSAAIALIVPLGREFLGSTRAGVIGAVLVLLHGPFVFHGVKLLYLPLALVGQAAAFVALGQARERPGPFGATIAGALLGLSVLVRTEMLLALPVFFLALATSRPRGPQRFVPAAACLVACGLVIAPATLHNARHGDLVLVASSGGENLFIGNQRGAKGDYSPIDPRAGDIFSERILATLLAEQEEGHSLRPSEVSAHWRAKAIREIAADPVGWLALEVRKLSRVVHPGDPTDGYSFPLERDLYLSALHLLPLPAWTLLAAGVIGIGLALRDRREQTWPLIAWVVIQFLTLLVFFVNTRLRLPLLYGLAPFAGVALEEGWNRWRSGKGRAQIGVLAVTLGVLTVGGAWLTAATPRDRIRLAAVLSSQGRLDESLAVLTPVLSGPQPYGLALDQAGWVHHKRGDLGEATARYRAALAAELPAARAVQTRTRLAMVLEKQGRLEESGEQHDLAVASAEATAGTLYERGLFRLRRGDLTGAARDLRAASELDPRWPAPRQALERLGDSD
jgi:tetratricopeptide (TPR) repeat protein